MKTSLKASLLKMIIKNHWSNQKSFPRDLILAKELVYDCYDFDCTQPQADPESAEYGGYVFYLNEKRICYREAKTTPTKTGQFVTLWKRNIFGIIEPFDSSDHIDFVIITARKNDRFGQFIFPKSILTEKEVFSTKEREGKRAIRVYAPWDITTSKQAQKTQQWQQDYFFEITPEVDFDSFENLLFI